jgi:ArsR family transcriptional regulator
VATADTTRLPTAAALDALSVLADPQRRAVLLRLTVASVCTCGDLVAELGVGQPTISHHLKVLREAGYVVGERCGRYVNYTVVPDRLRELGGMLITAADQADQAAWTAQARDR